MLYFVELITLRQLLDRKRFHRYDEREESARVRLHRSVTRFLATDLVGPKLDRKNGNQTAILRQVFL